MKGTLNGPKAQTINHVTSQQPRVERSSQARPRVAIHRLHETRVSYSLFVIRRSKFSPEKTKLYLFRRIAVDKPPHPSSSPILFPPESFIKSVLRSHLDPMLPPLATINHAFLVFLHRRSPIVGELHRTPY
ncbi:hypothetical protein Bca4012_068388 [Brassica carinata]